MVQRFLVFKAQRTSHGGSLFLKYVSLQDLPLNFGPLRYFSDYPKIAFKIPLSTVADLKSVRGQVFNVGHERLNSSKQEIIELMREVWPDMDVEIAALEFDGDMRSVHVSFEKIRRNLDFTPTVDIREGIEELHRELTSGCLCPPEDRRYRNHPPLVT